MEIFITGLAGAEIVDPLPLEFEDLIGLSAFRDGHGDFPIDGWDVDGDAKSAVDEAQRHFQMDIVALTFEIGMLSDNNFDIEIAVAAAVDPPAPFPGDANLLA